MKIRQEFTELFLYEVLEKNSCVTETADENYIIMHKTSQFILFINIYLTFLKLY